MSGMKTMAARLLKEVMMVLGMVLAIRTDTYSTAEEVSTVPTSPGNRIRCRFTDPTGAGFGRRREGPVSTMKGLTSIRCRWLPGCVWRALQWTKGTNTSGQHYVWSKLSCQNKFIL